MKEPLRMLVVAIAGWPVVAVADVISSPTLPPEEGQYVSVGDWHAYYNEYGITLTDPAHSRFTNIQRTIVGDDEEETFNSELTANTDLGPITLTGSVTTRVYAYSSGQTGTFDTEIISMSLSGSAGPMLLEIRESLSIQSLGSTTITDLGGGLYDIDSFFDVFTELRVDAGSGFGLWDDGVASPGSPRMEWEIPEPATFALFALSGLVLTRRRR